MTMAEESLAKVSEHGGTIDVFASSSNFENAQRMAKALASSSMVPEAYRGNLPNVLIAIELASRIGAMGYTISKVGRADRFDYPSSTVYYGPGASGVGTRLARQLSVDAQQAPGLLKDELLVVVGPKTIGGS